MADNPLLEIKDLKASVEGNEILRGVSLTVRRGEIHALMGPNGSGKSTLSNVLMGHPGYEVTGGEILFEGEDVRELEPDERARLGFFLAFQYPTSIPGVSLGNFLLASVKAVRGADNVKLLEFRKELHTQMKELSIDPSVARRYVNEGFSGGEKKRCEILQMALLKPKLAILDETDSGLDIDALKVVAQGVNRVMNPEMGMLLITHYQRLLSHIQPHHVHVLVNGRIVQSGGPELALELEEKGYDELVKAYGEAEQVGAGTRSAP
ncbi:MAG: Fe-S cluster assembly ATPase SufC [Armatimonadetes bacterium]|nr:Fe-S cluster assembly ATPase SufC [Armatimonadota bacterium]